MWKQGKDKKKTTEEKNTNKTKEIKLEKIDKLSKKQNIDKIGKIEKNKKEVSKSEKSLKIAFNILAIFCLVIFCISIVPKGLQNDTFYTIKLGQQLRETGVDYVDHYSWHENLPYMYPHWLYDIVMSLDV